MLRMTYIISTLTLIKGSTTANVKVTHDTISTVITLGALESLA